MIRRPAILPWTRAFTLIELLMAVVIFGIVLAAINTVFYGALRLQARTIEKVDEAQSLNVALDIIRRDLRNIVPPGGVMAGPFRLGSVSVGTTLAQFPGIEFCATTGVIDDRAPWGDIQRVVYQLRPATGRARPLGRDLIRCVTRNLLATTVQEAVEQRLLRDVETLDFLCFNGSDWRNMWDTTMTETNLPGAIQMRLVLAEEGSSGNTRNQPLEMIVPLVVAVLTNQTQTAGGGR
jgi:type II secretion system protein J